MFYPPVETFHDAPLWAGSDSSVGTGDASPLLYALAQSAAERRANLFAVDAGGRVTWANVAATEVWQRDFPLVGRHLCEVFPGIEHSSLCTPLRRAVDGGPAASGESPDAPLAEWYRWETRPLQGGGLLLTLRSPSRRKQAEDALQQRELFISKIAQAIPDLLYVYDLQNERSVYANRETASTLGHTPEEIDQMGTNLVAQICHPDDRAKIADLHRRLRDLPSGEVVETTYRVRHKDGSVRWILSRDVAFERDPQTGAVDLIVGVAQDITERKAVEAEKERILAQAVERASRDPLTNLYNHRTFHHRLRQEVTQAANDGSHLAIVALDIDNFKYFNDTFGHLVGDDILCRLAGVLRWACRKTDILARIGGDEFALVMPRVTGDAAQDWVRRLRDAAAEMVYDPGGGEPPVPFRLSVGVATFPIDTTDPTELIYLADKRALADKTTGAGREPEQLRQALAQQIEGFPMLDALVAAVDNKDRYTRQHSEEVMEYAGLIARQMGLNPCQTASLKTAALIHDVGKIGVPNQILRHPGALSPADYEAIKRHPALGGILVGAVPELAHTLAAVRHHHERWDGGGYPDGLAGEAIPLSARVMAVADAYSAMTTTRPYRRGLPPGEARARLLAGAGSQWDSQCVQALLRGLDTSP